MGRLVGSATSTTATATVAGYTLLSSDAWTLVEAHDPLADDPLAGNERPPLDWYAEYDGAGARRRCASGSAATPRRSPRRSRRSRASASPSAMPLPRPW